MCTLLVNPSALDIHTSHELLPAEFCWEKFLAAADGHDTFDPLKSVFFGTLTFDGRTIASGFVGLKGDFSIALGMMLKLNLVPKSSAVKIQAERYRLRWELRDGDPRRDRYVVFAEGELIGAANPVPTTNTEDTAVPGSGEVVMNDTAVDHYDVEPVLVVPDTQPDVTVSPASSEEAVDVKPVLGSDDATGPCPQAPSYIYYSPKRWARPTCHNGTTAGTHRSNP